MVVAAIAFLLGVLWVQSWGSLPDLLWLWGAPLLLVALRSARLRPPALFLLGAAWAMLHAAWALAPGLEARLEGVDLRLVGSVAAPAQPRERSQRFEFDVESAWLGSQPVELPTRVRLNWYGAAPELVPGEQWQLVVRLRAPRGFFNPGGFDYEGWLFRHRIGATGYVRQSDENRRLQAAGHRYPVQQVRQRVTERIGQVLGEGPAAAIVVALANGDRQGLGEAQWQVLRATGTNHLVAISGLHIGLVAGLLFFLVRTLWCRSSRLVMRWPAPRAAAVAALLGATLYAAMAGFSIPTQRALVMLVAGMAGWLLGRHTGALHAVALALFAVLLYDPLAVLDVGFWLSFGAVAIILYGMAGRPAASGLWWRWGRAQVVVAIGLSPLLLFFFQQTSVISPLANLLAVPWTGLVVVPLTLLGALLALLFPPLAAPLLHLAGLSAELLWWGLEGLARLPLAEWHRHPPPFWALLPGLVGVAWLLAPRGFPSRWAGLICLLPVLLWRPPLPADGEAWVTLLDVGQGLATVVRTRDHVLVYDTGDRFSSTFDAGSAVVVPYLRHHGIDALDKLIISHRHTDHSGGAPAVLAQFPPQRRLSGEPDYLPWLEAEPCHDGQQWQWNGVAFHVLHPPREHTLGSNDASCVVRIEAGGQRLLLTGDIEALAEARLLEQHAGRLDVDVLVVPHHGSRTSSSPPFIAATSPQHVLYPVGHRNRHHHPHDEVVARWAATGAAAWKSPAHGAIHLRLGGAAIEPSAWREQRGRYWNAR